MIVMHVTRTIFVIAVVAAMLFVMPLVFMVFVLVVVRMRMAVKMPVVAIVPAKVTTAAISAAACAAVWFVFTRHRLPPFLVGLRDSPGVALCLTGTLRVCGCALLPPTRRLFPCSGERSPI
jgi:hypothetical protein